MICPIKWAAMTIGLTASQQLISIYEQEGVLEKLNCVEEDCAWWSKASGYGNCAMVNIGTGLWRISEVIQKTSNRPMPREARR